MEAIVWEISNACAVDATPSNVAVMFALPFFFDVTNPAVSIPAVVASDEAQLVARDSLMTNPSGSRASTCIWRL